MAAKGKRQRRAQKRRKKKAKPKAKPPTATARPRDVAYNYWVTFVLYAVTGHTAQGDQMLVRHGEDIRAVARWLRRQHPVKLGALYRGVLVDPAQLEDGWLLHEEERKFLSWTERREVACWFADRDSLISELVADMHPGVRGFLVEEHGKPAELLWHYAWDSVLLPNGHRLDLALAGIMHPEIDEGQFAWNLRTQQEVITAVPSPSRLRVRPLAEGDCPPTDELDSRYAFPPYVAYRLGGGRG